MCDYSHHRDVTTQSLVYSRNISWGSKPVVSSVGQSYMEITWDVVFSIVVVIVANP